ncbi:hypothetical protein [Pedobacter soli]|uniref:Uncharacterized protein n=1 Tax=Pedobacter soli TaxID=390242 RepID=A0A1G6W272_9SPHI|nr:hypothetical protein [Pedobacter soli]SDD59145.1 hypothetical protein SAMN04488024_106317 [Pedobacter soli]
MDLKPIKYYLIVLLVILGFYGYSGLRGHAYYQDNVEKNTEFNGTSRHGGHVNRFYHK